MAIIFSLIIGFSRTPVIMVLVVTFLFLLPKLQYRSIFRSIRNLLTICAALLCGFFLFADEIFSLMGEQLIRIEQIENLLNGEFSPETTGNRSDLAERGFEMVQRDVFWGNGLMVLKAEVDGQFGVHNQYLLIWGEAGIIPLLFYLFYFIFYWRNSGSLEYDLKFLVRSIIAITMIYSLVNHSIYQSKTMLLICAFFAIMFIFSRKMRSQLRIE
jgi:O-antigen ligase